MSEQARQQSFTVRKLAAIMFTDIAGYTALMGSDETMAMQLVRENRNIQKPLIAKFNGTWLKEMGDGTMSSFPTASDAVNCALEIQRTLFNHEHIKLRIGIHLGEVMIEEGDVYGEGVNIASRLESIADPGGIYISDSIHKAIKSSLDIPSELLGELELKNVDYPVKTFALRNEFLPRPKGRDKKNLSGRYVAELKKRGVARAMLAYMTLAYLVYNGVRFLDLTPIFSDILVGILLTGIPISFLFAWNYERSPKGFIRINSRESWENPYSDAQKKPLTGSTIIIVLLLAAIGINFLPLTKEVQDKAVSSADNNEIAIAVMPFRNDSEDPSNLYFCNGLMEDIINQLSQLEGVRVPSVTSMLYYRDNPKPYPEIVRELNVSHLLEASVRKMESRALMTITLIDAARNERIWSERMELDLSVKGLFDLQYEVAEAVAKNMRLALIDTKSEMPTNNYEAYDLYLKARDLLRVWDIEKNTEAIETLHAAIRLDPDFKSAYIILGQAYGQRAEISNGKSGADSAYYYSKIALDLNPNDAAAMNAYAYSFALGGDKQTALQYYLKAYDLNEKAPNNYAGWCYYELGNYVKAVEWANKNILMDPNNSIYYIDMGNVTNALGLFNHTAVYTEKALNINPDFGFAMDNLMDMSIYKGDYVKSMEYAKKDGYAKLVGLFPGKVGTIYYKLGELDSASKYLNMPFEIGFSEINEDENGKAAVYGLLSYRYFVKYMSGDQDNAISELEQLAERIKQNLNDVDFKKYKLLSGIYATLGQKDLSLDYLKRASDLGYYHYYEYTTYNLLDPVRQDPKFIEIMNYNKARVDSMRSDVFAKGYLDSY